MGDSILAEFPDDANVLGPFLGNLPTVKVAVAAGVVGFVAGRLPTVVAVVAAGVVGFVVGLVAGRRSRPTTIVSTSDAPVEARPVATLEANPALSVDNALGPFLGNLPPEILDAVVRKLGWFETTSALAGKSCREAVERVASTRAVLTEDGSGLTQAELERLRSREMNPLTVAVMEGDVEALEWLMQLFDGKGLRWRDVGRDLSCLAAGSGKIESLTYLYANGCHWNESTCYGAAKGGHLEVLQWARQNGCRCDLMTCMYAAKGGHVEVLQWAHQNGCPWDEKTCRLAAERGHLEVLQWAHRNGCPWNEYTWKYARRICRPYLIEYGCPGAR